MELFQLAKTTDQLIQQLESVIAVEEQEIKKLKDELKLKYGPYNLHRKQLYVLKSAHNHKIRKNVKNYYNNNYYRNSRGYCKK